MKLPRAALATSNEPRSITSMAYQIYLILSGKRNRIVFMLQAETMRLRFFFAWRA